MALLSDGLHGHSGGLVAADELLVSLGINLGQNRNDPMLCVFKCFAACFLDV